MKSRIPPLFTVKGALPLTFTLQKEERSYLDAEKSIAVEGMAQDAKIAGCRGRTLG